MALNRTLSGAALQGRGAAGALCKVLLRGLAGSAPQAGWPSMCSLPVTCDSLGQHLSLPRALVYSAPCMPRARLILA